MKGHHQSQRVEAWHQKQFTRKMEKDRAQRALALSSSKFFSEMTMPIVPLAEDRGILVSLRGMSDYVCSLHLFIATKKAQCCLCIAHNDSAHPCKHSAYGNRHSLRSLVIQAFILQVLQALILARQDVRCIEKGGSEAPEPVCQRARMRRRCNRSHKTSCTRRATARPQHNK